MWNLRTVLDLLAAGLDRKVAMCAGFTIRGLNRLEIAPPSFDSQKLIPNPWWIVSGRLVEGVRKCQHAFFRPTQQIGGGSRFRDR